MDSLPSLPPTSRAVVHSSVVYSHSLTCPSDYQRASQHSGVSSPAMEMSDYYQPINGINTPCHRTQASFAIAAPSYRPPLTYSGEAMGKPQNFRSASSSSIESNPKIRDECELLNPSPNAHQPEYVYGSVSHPSQSCTSTNSSENEVQSLQQSPRTKLPTLRNVSSGQSMKESSFAPIRNPSMKDSRYSSDELYCGEAGLISNTHEGYPDQEPPKEDAVKTTLTAVERCLESKTVSGKKPSNAKVSEKRRQQNRAAQRAMRERRKRAAQNQEIHMSTIITENAILREKVTYLSNMLLSHAIAPGSHLPWTPISTQEDAPTMQSPLHNALLPPRSAPAPSSSSSTSPLSFSSPTVFPPPNLNGPSVFPSPHGHGPLLNYYPPGTIELEYHQSGNNAATARNLSCTSSNSNFSRPSTAEEPSVGHRTSVYGHWNNSSEGVNFRPESPITGRTGHFPLPGSLATDCCSINTASTISSPTQTDGNLVDALPASL